MFILSQSLRALVLTLLAALPLGAAAQTVNSTVDLGVSATTEGSRFIGLPSIGTANVCGVGGFGVIFESRSCATERGVEKVRQAYYDYFRAQGYSPSSAKEMAQAVSAKYFMDNHAPARRALREAEANLVAAKEAAQRLRLSVYGEVVTLAGNDVTRYRNGQFVRVTLHDGRTFRVKGQ